MPGFGRGPWWRGKFKGYGCRMTVPRQEILKVLYENKKHLTAEEVYMKVHKRYPNIGLTTVYRTLELLVDWGAVLRFNIGDGKARYELADEHREKKEHHHHLVCVSCHRIIDYDDFLDEEKELIEKTERALSKKYNFEIQNHNVVFQGLCSSCRSRK